MFTKTQKYIIVGLGILALVTTAVSFILKKPPTLPIIIETIPPNSSIKVPLDQDLRISFNSPIDFNLITINSIPNEQWIISEISSKEIQLKHRYALYPNTLYRLNILYDLQRVGELSFTTITSQSDPRLVQEIEDEVRRDYPLASKTPLERPGFSVVYSKPLTLEITLKEGIEERSEIINAVRDWVRENGLDPSSHSYVFSN